MIFIELRLHSLIGSLKAIVDKYDKKLKKVLKNLKNAR
jgi:hypothetical protein